MYLIFCKRCYFAFNNIYYSNSTDFFNIFRGYILINIWSTLCIAMFDINCRCNKFRSLSLLSPILLRYGVFNRLTPDAALPAPVDSRGEVARKSNNSRIFRKKSVSAKFKVSIMGSGGSSKLNPGLPSTVFLIFDALCMFPHFRFLSQKLYHRFNSEQNCIPSFVISWYFSNKIFTVISRL